jgi:hypothetical protein
MKMILIIKIIFNFEASRHAITHEGCGRTFRFEYSAGR